MASKARSLRSDKGDQLVTRAQVVAAIRHMVEHDATVREAIRAVLTERDPPACMGWCGRAECEAPRFCRHARRSRSSLWQRVKHFFRQGK